MGMEFDERRKQEQQGVQPGMTDASGKNGGNEKKTPELKDAQMPTADRAAEQSRQAAERQRSEQLFKSS